MPKHNPVALKKVTLSLPFGIGGIEMEPDSTERDAAWELYVELVTRVAVQSLHPQEGLVREAMNSLYSLFGSTREILRKAGPGLGLRMIRLGELRSLSSTMAFARFYLNGIRCCKSGKRKSPMARARRYMKRLGIKR